MATKDTPWFEYVRFNVYLAENYSPTDQHITVLTQISNMTADRSYCNAERIFVA